VPPSPDPTSDPSAALGTYLDVVDSCAPGLVEGLYVVGSYALGDWRPGRSDIDVVAVTSEPATEDDAGALRTAHAVLAEARPRPAIDGPYVAWGDLVTPPQPLHRPWVLDGDLHHDAECFEINPVTWYVLATYGVTVRGPRAEQLGTYVDVDARVRFVVDNLAGYWAPLADDVRRRCDLEPGARFRADSFEWCALGALRLHLTAFTGDVTSKRGAGEYGLDVVPEDLRPVLHAALAVRSGEARDDEGVPAELMRGAADVVTWCASSVGDAASPGA